MIDYWSVFMIAAFKSLMIWIMCKKFNISLISLLGLSRLTFLIQVEISLVFGMTDDFFSSLLCLGHFVSMLTVSGSYLNLWFYQAVTLLTFSTQVLDYFCGPWFQLKLNFQSLCGILVCVVYLVVLGFPSSLLVPSEGQKGLPQSRPPGSSQWVRSSLCG